MEVGDPGKVRYPAKVGYLTIHIISRFNYIAVS